MFHSFFRPLAKDKYLYTFSFLFSLYGPLDRQNPIDDDFFFLQIKTRSDLLTCIGNPFVSQSPKEFYVSFFLRKILVYASTIYQPGEILVPGTFPSGSPFPPCHVYSYISFVLVCSIRLLYGFYYLISANT